MEANSSLNDKTDVNVQTSGELLAEQNQNPASDNEKAQNARTGSAPNASGGSASSSVEDHVPSQSSPDTSDIPSTYKVSSQPESLEGEEAVGEGVNPEDED